MSQFIEMLTPLWDAQKTIPLDSMIQEDSPITYGILMPGHHVEDGVPVVKVKDMVEGKITMDDMLKTSKEIDEQYKRSRLRENDVLLSIRGTIGRVAVIPQELNGANITQDTARLRLKPQYDPFVLKYVLESPIMQFEMEQNKRGATIKGINIGYVREMPIPWPESKEQVRLKAIASQSDKSGFDGIKSQFIEMFPFKENPYNWPILSFCQFASIDATMTSDFETYADYPHIGIDSIEQDTGRLIGYRTVRADNVKSGKYIFTANHIIYSKIRPNLNKVATPDFTGLCSADSYPILPNTELMSKNFLVYLLRSETFLEYIIPLSNRTGMPKVNRDQVEGFSIPGPPLPLQEQFVAIAEQADKSGYYIQKLTA